MVRILTIPFNAKTELFEDDALQGFLLNKTVLRLEPVFFQQGHRAFWTVQKQHLLHFVNLL